METISVDAEQAFALCFELFKAKPWLNDAGTMQPSDEAAEAEAMAFLLAADWADDWGTCSRAARRIVNSLILDFMARLQYPHSSLSQSTWQVQPGPEWRQALDVIGQEIRRSHPRLSVMH